MSDDGVFLEAPRCLDDLLYWRCSFDCRPTVCTKNNNILSPLKNN